MRLRVSLALAVLAAALLAVPGAPAGSKATYYVSLGDSLAQGFQPIGGPQEPRVAARLQPRLRGSALQADASRATRSSVR